MQYALLIYGGSRTSGDAPPGPLTEALAAVLSRPEVIGWARLHAADSASTLRADSLLTDGPFVDSKEHLAGLIMIEAANLDAALEITRDLQDTSPGVAIEVRPAFETRCR